MIATLVMTLAGGVWLGGKERIPSPKKAQAHYKKTSVERKDMVNAVSATGELSAVVTVAVLLAFGFSAASGILRISIVHRLLSCPLLLYFRRLF